jgi:hypothetical protein
VDGAGLGLDWYPSALKACFRTFDVPHTESQADRMSRRSDYVRIARDLRRLRYSWNLGAVYS